MRRTKTSNNRGCNDWLLLINLINIGIMQAFPRLFMQCKAFISTPIRHITKSVTAYSAVNTYNRRTGRGYANDMRHRDLPRLILAKKRGFTRTIARLVGVDSGLEKIMLMLDVGKKPKQRKLNDAKRNRLGRMFLEYIFQILCEHDRFCDLEGLELYRIDVGPTFKVMDVYWLARGDESDEIAEEVLKKSEDFVRKKLSELLGNHSVPRITFVPERKHLLEKEMNILFEKADYGVQYRALSHTGAILGSMADTGSSFSSGQRDAK
uniref:Ribosome-binding factor A n=1 Tax=Setaria digitata TaxID=48799 RepID=A0A915Q611_9BILA